MLSSVRVICVHSLKAASTSVIRRAIHNLARLAIRLELTPAFHYPSHAQTRNLA